MYSPWCTFFAKQFIHFEIWDKIYNTTHGMWCGVVERHLEMSQATKNIFTTLKYYVLLTNIKRRTSDYTYFYSGEEFQPKKKKRVPTRQNLLHLTFLLWGVVKKYVLTWIIVCNTYQNSNVGTLLDKRVPRYATLKLVYDISQGDVDDLQVCLVCHHWHDLNFGQGLLMLTSVSTKTIGDISELVRGTAVTAT